MSRIEAVFFDCDGTLVDSEVICSRAYVTMFQEFGITLDPEEVFKRFKGVKLYEIIDIQNWKPSKGLERSCQRSLRQCVWYLTAQITKCSILWAS